MKKMIFVIVLVFVSISCFAVDGYLKEGTTSYFFDGDDFSITMGEDFVTVSEKSSGFVAIVTFEHDLLLGYTSLIGLAHLGEDEGRDLIVDSILEGYDKVIEIDGKDPVYFITID